MKSLMLGALVATALFSTEASAQGYCREYSQGVSIGGQRQSSYGVACMQPDGSWQVVSSQQGYNGGYNGGFNGGGYDYNYTPQPSPVYVPTPVPVYRPSSVFSLSFGVPYHRGRGDCDDRRGWGWGGHHGHHGHGHGHGWKHGRW